MENYNLVVKGKQLVVHVENVENGHSISTESNGVIKKYIIKGLVSNYQAKEIKVDYAIVNEDNQGGVLGSERGIYVITDPVEFNYFYSFEFVGNIGTCIAKHCINGLLYRLFGVRCFNENLVFYQPISFDVSIINNDITIVPVDGIAPFSFSLDSVNWTENPEFLGLPYGTHTVHVKDSTGITNYAKIDLVQNIEAI